MGKKLSEELKDIEELDLDKPSFEELCKKNYPTQWKISTLLMWLIFIGFVGFSVFNNYKNSIEAKGILSENKEVMAEVIDTTQILEDGDYTDYSVELEVLAEGETKQINLEIAQELFESTYSNAKEIPIIYSSENEYNVKSYYERKADMFSNWISILFGYLIVFLILFFGRHFLLKLICSKTGE